jgi:hypothetical protein
MQEKIKPDAEMIELLKLSGSDDERIAYEAQRKFAMALTLPLRKGVMNGNNFAGIFEEIPITDGTMGTVEYPLDILAPGTEKDFVAYTIPNAGRLPERTVESDYVRVPTYEIGNTIDWLLKYAKNARWDIVSRCLNILRSGFTVKLNNDAWHTLVMAAVDRNIVVYDGDAAAGQFTKRLVSLGKIMMRRNGGGNSTSMDRGQLTDLYLSPEGLEDIRNWNVDQVDDATRREIYLAPDDGITNIYNVRLHALDELGVGQPYQNYFSTTLSGSLASGDVELAIGLDLGKNDSFVMPVDEALKIYPDPQLHRARREGYYGWSSQGFGILDARRILALSY